MPFRYKRINIENHNKDELKSLDMMLNQNYFYQNKFEEIKKSYLEDRKAQKDPQYLSDPQLRVIVEKYFEKTAWDLLLNYVIGVKETAFYLASSYINGYGVDQDEFLSHLTLAVGVKLGDEKSIKMLDGEETLPAYIQQFADRCIKEIKKHEAEVQNRDVSCEEIMARAKAFDYFVKTNTNHSYYDTIHEKNNASMKHFSYYVEPIIENNSQDHLEPIGESTKCHCEIC
ncbi:hypothetical protein [Rickettsia prowazekii]|uniref:Uncharacterized protein RP277 n=2 Tax=Rickettsia prowazekii TaxID=782 RepID=Y277_RICPR|nr:hypothetical protein [Rickettsia prowazekii]Q9ZDQ0.1 RecName: Full=Uncharacterized protein RP277 [Rickettsia prowazekii str. Madrid E]EOB09628.1 hypothetical protein H376_5730 [Rickettsia prowazekii str. GvF12]ADE29788.1 hypothetical protein rpr22_CDS272 [Rickettsia prowazekii str. Rp22]AFE49095.1 hypothetical protein M9W_01350 [Rickettsia prowazekii str. Chernikova]AFE49940.1 hypothetical protein M9Y_01350 [Rickettsia prowazekii str. Katsinyian]AFE50784.1 hypothetical protein MA1_01340 [R